jgi:hypothetical protein
VQSRKKLLAGFAPFITALQIVQMAVGMLALYWVLLLLLVRCCPVVLAIAVLLLLAFLFCCCC